MEIDAATRRNLELDARADRRAPGLAARGHRPHGHRRRRAAPGRLAGGPAHRSRRDRCAARHAWPLSSPSRGCARICASALRRAPDIERALSRLLLGRGGPRDLAAHRATASPPPRRCAERLAGARRPAGRAAPGGAQRSAIMARLVDRAGPRAGGRAAAARPRRRLHRRRAIARARRAAQPARREPPADRSSWRRAIAARPASPPSRSATTTCSAITSRSTATQAGEADANGGASSIARPWPMPMRFTTVELGELERGSPAPPTRRWPSSSSSSRAGRRR